MTKLDRIIYERTKARAVAATAAADMIIAALRSAGLDAVLIGSLARGEFKAHSDIDILVRGHADAEARAEVDRVVARILRDAGIPCDVVYLEDLPPYRHAEFEVDVLS